MIVQQIQSIGVVKTPRFGWTDKQQKEWNYLESDIGAKEVIRYQEWLSTQDKQMLALVLADPDEVTLVLEQKLERMGFSSSRSADQEKLQLLQIKTILDESSQFAQAVPAEIHEALMNAYKRTYHVGHVPYKPVKMVKRSANAHYGWLQEQSPVVLARLVSTSANTANVLASRIDLMGQNFLGLRGDKATLHVLKDILAKATPERITPRLQKALAEAESRVSHFTENKYLPQNPKRP